MNSNEMVDHSYYPSFLYKIILTSYHIEVIDILFSIFLLSIYIYGYT